MKIKGKHIVILALLLLSAGLAYDSISSYINPYLSVEQVLGDVGRYKGRSVQIMGIVSNNSISRGENGAVSFSLTNGKEVLPVVYNGSMPNGFDQGKDVVIVGTMKGDGTLQASQILVKCPSKYEGEGAGPLSDHIFLAAILLFSVAGVYFFYAMVWRRG